MTREPDAHALGPAGTAAAVPAVTLTGIRKRFGEVLADTVLYRN